MESQTSLHDHLSSSRLTGLSNSPVNNMNSPSSLNHPSLGITHHPVSHNSLSTLHSSIPQNLLISELCGRSQGTQYPLESWLAAAAAASSSSPSSGSSSTQSGGTSSSSSLTTSSGTTTTTLPSSTTSSSSTSSISVNGNSINASSAALLSAAGLHPTLPGFKAHPGSSYPSYLLSSSTSSPSSTGSSNSVPTSVSSSAVAAAASSALHHYVNPLFPFTTPHHHSHPMHSHHPLNSPHHPGSFLFLNNVTRGVLGSSFSLSGNPLNLSLGEINETNMKDLNIKNAIDENNKKSSKQSDEITSSLDHLHHHHHHHRSSTPLSDGIRLRNDDHVDCLNTNKGLMIA